MFAFMAIFSVLLLTQSNALPRKDADAMREYIKDHVKELLYSYHEIEKSLNNLPKCIRNNKYDHSGDKDICKKEATQNTSLIAHEYDTISSTVLNSYKGEIIAVSFDGENFVDAGGLIMCTPKKLDTELTPFFLVIVKVSKSHHISVEPVYEYGSFNRRWNFIDGDTRCMKDLQNTYDAPDHLKAITEWYSENRNSDHSDLCIRLKGEPTRKGESSMLQKFSLVSKIKFRVMYGTIDFGSYKVLFDGGVTINVPAMLVCDWVKVNWTTRRTNYYIREYSEDKWHEIFEILNHDPNKSFAYREYLLNN